MSKCFGDQLLLFVHLLLITNSISLVNWLIVDRIEEGAEKVEPFMLLYLAITIGIESGNELVDLRFTSSGICVFRKANTLKGKLLNLESVELTIAIKVELVECLLSHGKSHVSGSLDVNLLWNFFLLLHIRCRNNLLSASSTVL